MPGASRNSSGLESLLGSGPDWSVGSRWNEEGLCYQSPDWMHWFPDLAPTWEDAVAWSRDAIETCQKCPVILMCSQYARDTKQPAGIWAGITMTGSRYGNRVE